MKRGWLKNTALATILSTTLTACGGGGGGGGGAVGTVSNFIQNDFADLSGAGDIVSENANLVDNFFAKVKEGNWGSIKAVITGPTAEDISTANSFLIDLNTAIDNWNKAEKLISNQSDSIQYSMYNSDEYKNAYAAMIYLKDHVKPILEKVSEGKTITLEQYNKVAKKDRAEEIITAEKETSVLSYVDTKLVKSSTPNGSTTEIYNEIEPNGDALTEPVAGLEGQWTVIEGKGGKEKRKISTTTPQKRVIKKQICSWTDVVTLTAEGNITNKINETCDIKTTETPLDNKIEYAWEERDGENPVVGEPRPLDPITSDPVFEFNSNYGTDGILTVPEEIGRENKTEVVPGEETTSTEPYTKTRTEPTDTKNQIWVIVDNWLKTTITKPAVSTTYDEVTYKDVKTKQKRSWTITTLREEVTYADGTTAIIETPQDKEYTNWTTMQVSAEKRTERENEESTDIFLTPDIKHEFVSQASKTLKDNAYTDADEDLGTQTIGLSKNAKDFQTDEFVAFQDGNGEHQLGIINADKAYARGWTGKGSVVAVVDTGYDVDHSEFDGQIIATKDYTGKGINDNHGHGTHVLGNIIAKRDGKGTHGVAFDAKAVVVKVADGSSVDLDKAAEGLSWAADQGAVVGNLSANKNYDYTFRNNLTKLDDGTYKVTPNVTDAGDVVYDYSQNIFYGRMTADNWKSVTDKGMVLVNSAGNRQQGGLDVPANPGYMATAVDENGNLILGGKMLIVGAADYNKDIASFSNKAGHICQQIVDNACQDKYKVSDFYVMAPGWTTSAKNDGTYSNMTGTSMAAPLVTGGVAILHQMWPHMKGENLVKLITTTADKDLPNYNVNIHGQGMMDLDEATKPQGAVGIPTTGRVDGAISSVSSTAITGSAIIMATLSNVEIMIIDEFDRDYYVGLGNSFTVKDNRKYSDIDMLLSNNNTYLPTQQMYGSFAQGGQWDLAQNYNFGFYTGENGNGDYSTNIGKNFFITDRFKLKTGVGTMSEQDTWLGNSSEGVLAVGDNNNTNFGNIGVDYQIGNNVLSLDYTRGKTNINTVEDSIIKSFSNVETESYRLAYEIHKDKHNTLGWSFSLPSHITSGTMDLEVAESVNLDGTINYETIRSDLTQSTKEKNIGFYFNHTPTHDTDATYNFTAEYRQDVAGESSKDGINLAMNYTKKFWGSCKFLWMKNPKCYTKDENGKDVLTAENKALMFGNNNTDPATKLGLRYDMKTDMFVPINPEDKKWKQ